MKPLIFSGRSHPSFAHSLAAHLHSKVGRADIHSYSDGETYVRVLEPKRVLAASHAMVVQSGNTPVHDHVVELLLLADALQRMGPSRITAVMPFLPYRRQEHIHEEGEGIGGELMMRLCKTAGISDLITADLHHESFRRFFGRRLKEVSALPLFIDYFKRLAVNTVVVAPDKGGIERAKRLAEAINAPMFHIPKKRLRHDRVEKRSLLHHMTYARAIIIDDEINTGGTIISCAHALRARGVRDIYVAATHGILSGKAVQELKAAPLREIVITDTIPLPREKKMPHMKILSIVPLFADMLQ